MNGLDKKCYLCGSKKLKWTGTFVSNDDSVHWVMMGKLPRGEKRISFVHLCDRCFNRPNKEELVEEKINSNLEGPGYMVTVE